MCVAAAAAGIGAAGSLGAAALGGGGGGGGGSGSNVNYTDNLQSLGQTLTGIMSGDVSTALGLQGLSGGNLNQLQAGAVAANPFGSQADQYYGALSSLLNGGIQGQVSTAQNNELSYLNSIMGNAQIGTNTGALNNAATIGPNAGSNALTSLVNNPQSVSLPSSVQSILSQNPYSFTSGEQFQYQQGMNAVNSTMAQQGLIGSGNQAVSLEQYGQNYASQATQQNITNLLNAQSAANTAYGTQTGAASGLGSLLSQQGQNTFSNLLGTQQLQTTQQQGTAGNLLNLLSGMTGINSQAISGNEGLLSSLLTATQASQSSPSTAGGILANLGVANQVSAGNLSSGLGGLANGLGNLASGLNFGSSATSSADAFSTGNVDAGYNAALYGPSGFGDTTYSGYSGTNGYGFYE